MIIGRLGRDPELRYTQSGAPIANLNIATDESYTDRDGNRQERTEWHRVVVFQRQAETCANYLTKGRLVYVEGSLQTRKWQDQEGKDRFTTEIKAQTVRFLDRGQDRPLDGQDAEQASPGPNYQKRGYGSEQGGGYGARRQQSAPPDDDFGPAFPSEGAAMDEVPF